MTGPEHYQEAERLLQEAAATEVHDCDPESLPYVARAQVHASLAVAAALAGLGGRAERVAPGSRLIEEANEWARAIAPLVPKDPPDTSWIQTTEASRP